MEPEFGGTINPDVVTSDANVLYGRAGDDVLGASGPGPAYIDGGQGDDHVFAVFDVTTVEFFGGSGNDIVEGHDLDDRLDGGSGDDLVTGGHFSIPIGGVGAVGATGPSGHDHIAGGDGTDALYGFDGNDEISGGAGDDRGFVLVKFDGGSKQIVAGLLGAEGSDYLDGGSGDDAINGGDGIDTLVGGPGADQFFFDAQPGKANADTILDFTPNVDSIVLDPDVFTTVGEPGFFPAVAFRVGKKAKQADDRILYDPKSGKLSLDPDGSKHDGKVVFAQLDKGLKLDYGDFFMDT